MDDQLQALKLGGMAMAHAAWSIEDGSTLCTLAFIERDGERELVRYEAETIDDSRDAAHADLRDRLRGGGVAALVYDGYITPQGGARTDALVMELFGPDLRALGRVVQAYQPARRSRIPLVGRASGFRMVGELVISDAVTVPDADRVMFDGTQEHPKAAKYFVREAEDS